VGVQREGAKVGWEVAKIPPLRAPKRGGTAVEMTVWAYGKLRGTQVPSMLGLDGGIDYRWPAALVTEKRRQAAALHKKSLTAEGVGYT